MSKQATNEKERVNGVLLQHAHCPECLSNDNLAIYAKVDEEGKDVIDGSCFTPSCKKFWTEAELKEAGVLDENMVIPKVKPVTRTAITKAEYKALTARTSHDTTMKDGSLYRGIKGETAKFYGHLYSRDNNGNVTCEYYPETKETFKGELNSLRGYKSRTLPKTFGTQNIGITGLTSDFSGQHLFRQGGKYVVVTSGEIDKLSIAQMLRDYQLSRGQEDYDRIAVVSVTTGEATLAKQCAAQYDWLDSFDNILLCGDTDDVGKAAVAEAVTKLPAGKVKVITLSMKDANEMLMAGKHKQFISNYYDAKDLVDTGIKSFGEATKGMKEFLLAPKIPFPPMMHRMNEASRGGVRSTGAIVNIIADTSIGKTLVSDNLQLFWAFNSPLLPTTLSIERTQEEFAIDMCSNHFKHNLTWCSGQDAVDYLETEEAQQIIHDLSYDEYGQPRFYIIDERGGKLELIQRQVEKAWKSLGSRLFILDPLSDILRHLPNEAQEQFMMWEKQMKKEGLVFINILHTRKPMPNKDGTIRPVTEYDALGSSSFVQSADINIVLNRNKMADDDMERNTMTVEAPKLRGGKTGHICDLIYDPATRQQYDKQDFMEQQRSNF